MKPETVFVHAGAEPDPATSAIAPPMHLSTTFRHGPAGEIEHGHEYIRESNPTQDRLEAALAAIEHGAAALAFASGMAATGAVLQSVPAGAHVLLPRDVYHGTRAWAQAYFAGRGVTHAAADLTDPAAVEAAWRPGTALVWIETPSNPLIEVVDVAAIARLAGTRGARVAVDSTFASPALQNPLALGADVVMHSSTKYLGGHSDVMGGVLAFRERGASFERALAARTLQGAVMAPFNAWLTLRGLRTLACRIDRHCANAQAVAEFLEAHRAVARVRYPGLASHPQHALAKRQMRGYGGMLSIELAGGREAALALASRVELFTNATSLGGVESLIEHRASIEGAHRVSPESLLRLSVGIEHPDDLVADLAQALR